ncbi:Ig-like domain-containing protein [Photobacterium sp. DA100]|uniref:Ig-like domain-containing protein n=1 Tax=Photobacterium sp. DA100 TaxID=3027472 RepID=UPI00247B2A25|nr:Ig-like domain-containing protein [Photobacterium sp. DA100]WEM43695.1 Ig-like domain-containing protein [Photobacterium sp. DA100]
MKKLPLAGIIATLLSPHVFADGYDCTDLEIWNSTTQYNGGVNVQHLDHAYKANWWSQGSAPDKFSGQYQEWSLLGQCETGEPQPPTISITSPQYGGQFVLDKPILLAAEVSSKNSEIKDVEFLVNGESVAVITQAPFSTEWTPSQLGQSVVTVRATNVDNMTESSQASITIVDSDISLPPNVTLTSPGAGSVFDEGDTVTFSADASSEHGSIERVEFYLNDAVIGSDSSAPYEYRWTSSAGSHAIYAQAIDSNQQSSKTQSTHFTVNGKQPGGSCKELPAYAEGQSYTQGQLVTNVDNQYSCQIPGWCGGAAWAYEPGVGLHWQDAWQHEGDCGAAPELSFTSPAAGETLLAGIPTDLIVNTTAGAFDIAKVQFFADNQLIGNGVVDGTKYQLEWIPVNTGSITLKAVATDTDNGEGETTQQVTVTDQALAIDLTKPTAGSRFSIGSPVEMTADAKSFQSEIERVDFLVNGRVVATAHQAPYQATWRSEAAGDYQIQAKAIAGNGDEELSSAVTISVTLSTENKHKLVGYWHNFVNGSVCPMNLSDIPTEWDVIDIAFADTNRASPGTNYFNLFSGDGGCPAIDANRFKQDIQALQAEGRKVVLSLGGAEGTIILNDDASEQAFVDSLTAIVQEWGFDGLDVDYESGSGLVNGSEIQKRLPRALRSIQDKLGRDLYLTMAPEHPYVQGGYVSIADGSVWGAYLPVIDATRDMLDLLHVQLYNNGGLEHPYGGTAPAGSVDMMVAAQKMLVEGFQTAYGNGPNFEPLRDDQVSIGLPSGAKAAGSGQATIADTNKALDCLVLGTQCDTVVPAKRYDNFGGVMFWSINWDEYYNRAYSQGVGAKLSELNQR